MKTSHPKPLHIPVLLSEILTEFEPLGTRVSLRYFDGTLGRGGHLKAVLDKFPQATALGIDQDPEAIAYVAKELSAEISAGRLELKQMSFHDMPAQETPEFDLALLDLGVSSPQLDEGRRGFSFYVDGPLDMRMDPSKGMTAAEFVNTATPNQLFEVFRNYGEIYRPLKTIGRIVQRREEMPFTSTLDLANVIEKSEGWRKKGFHPATPWFMAIRIHINNELGGLEESLPRLLSCLRPGGRLAVLTFHSLEDRIVKNIFRDSEEFGRPVHKRVIVPTREEETRNPRARSAKLRVFEKADPESDKRADTTGDEQVYVSAYQRKQMQRSQDEDVGSSDATDLLSDSQMGPPRPSRVE